jgi:hypothetical protein
MSKQEALYSATYMNLYGIKPFPIDLQVVDLEGNFLLDK